MVGPKGETTYNLHNGSWEGGKGSHTRGKDKKSYDAYDAGWDAIFGKKKVSIWFFLWEGKNNNFLIQFYLKYKAKDVVFISNKIMIKVLQIGFGPLGVQIAKFIANKSTIKTVAVVDSNLDLYNRKINEISSELDDNIYISNSINEALLGISEKPDVPIITTVSNLSSSIMNRSLILFK